MASSPVLFPFLLSVSLHVFAGKVLYSSPVGAHEQLTHLLPPSLFSFCLYIIQTNVLFFLFFFLLSLAQGHTGAVTPGHLITQVAQQFHLNTSTYKRGHRCIIEKGKLQYEIDVAEVKSATTVQLAHSLFPSGTLSLLCCLCSFVCCRTKTNQTQEYDLILQEWPRAPHVMPNTKSTSVVLWWQRVKF